MSTLRLPAGLLVGCATTIAIALLLLFPLRTLAGPAVGGVDHVGLTVALSGGPARHMMIREPSGNRLEFIHRPPN